MEFVPDDECTRGTFRGFPSRNMRPTIFFTNELGLTACSKPFQARRILLSRFVIHVLLSFQSQFHLTIAFHFSADILRCDNIIVAFI